MRPALDDNGAATVPHEQLLMRDFQYLRAIGLCRDEIWCAIVEPGPWSRSRATVAQLQVRAS